MKLNFCSLSSGSSGNCYYIGNEFHGILIDAGISASSVCKFLKDMDISMQTIMGVLITHNHTDHIKGLKYSSEKTAFLPSLPGKYGKAFSLQKPKYTVTVFVKFLYRKNSIWQVSISRHFRLVTMLLKQSDFLFPRERKR